jgi:Mn-dependent DtxR family transcriptional regulator
MTNLQTDEVETASDMEKLGWIEFREGGSIKLTGKGNAQFRLQFGD